MSFPDENARYVEGVQLVVEVIIKDIISFSLPTPAKENHVLDVLKYSRGRYSKEI